MAKTGHIVDIKSVLVFLFVLIIISGTTAPFPIVGLPSSHYAKPENSTRESKNATAWTKLFGGLEYEIGFSALQTDDGGYIVAGETSSSGAGDADCWLIKTDKYGDEEWNRTYGGKFDDVAYSVQQTADGGYILTGATHSYVGYGIDVEGYPSSDVWVVKTDAQGIEEWNRSFSGVFWDFGYSVEQTIDGGYIVCANLAIDYLGFYDIWLIKLDKNGAEEWNRTYGDWKNDIGYSVHQTTDGGFIITGETERYTFGLPEDPNYSESDIWLLKTDPDGNEQWNQTFGGDMADVGNAVRQTKDNGYIIVGTTGTFYHTGNTDIWLIKTDEKGEYQWGRIYGSNNSFDDTGYSVENLDDGGYVIAGSGKSDCFMMSSIWLIRTNRTGAVIWEKYYGRGNNNFCYSVNATSDGGFIITGAQNFDVFLIKTGPDGFCPELNEPPENSIKSYRPLDKSNIFIEGTASDSYNDIMQIEIKLEEKILNTIESNGNWSFTWDISELDDGIHTLYVRAFDGELFSEPVNISIAVNNGMIEEEMVLPRIEWWKTIGTPNDDYGRDVLISNDGNYILSGITVEYDECGFDSNYNMFVVKTDIAGNEKWRSVIDIEYFDYYESIEKTSDGGFVLLGLSGPNLNYDEPYYSQIMYTNILLVKLDSNGRVQWNMTYGPKPLDPYRPYTYGNSVRQTTDGGFIIAGSIWLNETDSYDLWLIRTDAFGNEVWNRTFDFGSYDESSSIIPCSDGGFMVLGQTEISNRNTDILLLKIDGQGNEQWNTTFGGTKYDSANDIRQTSDGGFIIVGSTNIYGWRPPDEHETFITAVILIKTDGTGNLEWLQMFGGKEDDFGRSVCQTRDGGYVIIGKTNSYDLGNEDVWIIKTDGTGRELWNMTLGNYGGEGAHGIEQTSDGGFIIGGTTESYNTGYYDMFLIKLGLERVDEFEDQPPFCQIDYPSNNSVIKGNITITGTSWDKYGTVKKVQIMIDFGVWLEANGTGTWNYLLQSNNLENGEHIIYSRAFDGEQYTDEPFDSIIVIVNNSDQNPREGDTKTPLLWVILVTTVVVVVILVLILILIRQKFKPRSQDPDEREKIPDIPGKKLLRQ